MSGAGKELQSCESGGQQRRLFLKLSGSSVVIHTDAGRPRLLFDYEPAALRLLFAKLIVLFLHVCVGWGFVPTDEVITKCCKGLEF